MRRKILGFLLLALVVCAGIVFVELRSGPSAKVAAAQGSSPDLVFRAVLGGSMPVVPEPEQPLADGGRRESPPIETGRAPRNSEQDDGPRVPKPIVEPDREPIHTVRGGDSLSKIAQDYFGTREQRVVDRIAARNSIKDRNAIHPGSKVVVPVERFEMHVANGAETIADIALAAFGARSAIAPIIRFNPGVGSAPKVALPKGTRVFIPR